MIKERIMYNFTCVHEKTCRWTATAPELPGVEFRAKTFNKLWSKIEWGVPGPEFKFGIPTQLTEEPFVILNEDPIEITKSHKGVYMLFYEEILMMIGQTMNAHRRIRQHGYNRIPTSDIFFVELQSYESRIDMETNLIRHLNPQYNISQNQRYSTQKSVVLDFRIPLTRLAVPRVIHPKLFTYSIEDKTWTAKSSLARKARLQRNLLRFAPRSSISG